MSLYNEDELTAPSWINADFFQMVLENYEKADNVQINELVISPASMKGDHYASIMFRCKVDYSIGGSLKSRHQSFILKTSPDAGMKADILQQTKAFETEINMYTNTLPKIQQILKENGEACKLAADIIYHSLEPHKVLIFEDLCLSGYEVLRSRLLTEEELHLVYRKLAKLHAASFILGQTEEHDCVTKYDQGIFSNSAVATFDFVTGGIKKFIDLLAQHVDFQVYLEKVKIMEPEMFAMCHRLYNASKLNANQKECLVLNHGDFHLKNLMFKFDAKNQADDLIMVDYQFSCYAPMNIDLIYSQFMMMQPAFRLKRNQFMHYYFSEFLRILRKLNYPAELPRYSDLQMANLKYRHFVLFLLSTFLPLNHIITGATEEELKGIDVSEFIENANVTAGSLYSNPAYTKELRQLLPSLLIDGYLD